MAPSSILLTVDRVRGELIRLRHGQGLARPSVVLHLSPALRAHLVGRPGQSEGSADEAVALTSALQAAVAKLNEHERPYVEVDFNLDSEHSFPTLTERRESLAGRFRCSSKTIRRHADRALESLAFILAATCPQVASVPESSSTIVPVDGASWRRELNAFWKLSPTSRVDIVCSEIPEDERPSFASPLDRNYLRYAKFADLDTLIYVRTRLTQTSPDVHVRDFAPSEYFGADSGTLVVIGGPPWNAKYREFLPHLPFYFDPHPLGEDDPLVVPILGNLTMGPRWTERRELLEDLAVFTRLTLAQGTTIFLLGGCLTLGVLGAAKCFLEGGRGARNVRYITNLIGDRDFVLVTEARRLGGITDAFDLEASKALLILARDGDLYLPIVNNTARYTGALTEAL